MSVNSICTKNFNNLLGKSPESQNDPEEIESPSKFVMKLINKETPTYGMDSPDSINLDNHQLSRGKNSLETHVRRLSASKLMNNGGGTYTLASGTG